MKTFIKVGILLTIILIGFSSCNFLNSPQSPTERLASFQDHLNTEFRTNTIDHIHPDAVIYELIDSTYWDSSPLDIGNNPYIFTVTMSTAVDGIVTGTGTVNYNNTDLSVILTFKESTSGNGDWYILSLTINTDLVIW